MAMKKTKTRQEVADEYGLSRSTLYRQLRELGIEKRGKLLMPSHLAQIYQHLGFPGGMSEREKAEWQKEILRQDAYSTRSDTN